MYENMETLSTTIDNSLWEINPYPATVGAGYLKRLFKLFGKSFSVLIEAGEVEGGITKAVEMLVDNLDNDDVIQLITAMTKSLKKDGKAVNFDNEFARRYHVLLQVMQWIVTENFGGFFPNSGSVSE